MNRPFVRFVHRLFLFIPKLRLFYLAAKRYADDYQGDNNWDMYLNGEYRLLKHNLTSCRIAFDVGAYLGEWTKFALGVNPNLNIHCFEPSRSSFLELTAALPASVICNNVALSSRRGTAKLYVWGKRSGNNSLYRRSGLKQSWGIGLAPYRQLVKLDTIDHYCAVHHINQVDFIKIDVEGHELEVLKGMRQLIKRGGAMMVQFEYGGTYIDSRTLLKDIFEFFHKTSYRLYKIFPNRIEQVPQYDVRHENLSYQNWVAIRRDHRFVP